MSDQPLARAIRGCKTCRAAHAKCDTQLPSCSRCMLLESECIRGHPFPFRHANITEAGDKIPTKNGLEFAQDQIWVCVPHNIEFVAEQLMLDGQDDDEPDLQPATPTSPNGSILQSPLNCSPHSSQGEPPGSSIQANTTSSPDQPVPDEYPWTPETTHARSQHALEGSSSTGTTRGTECSPILSVLPQTPSTVTSSSQHWPLVDEKEILLLRHFVINLSIWFDYCDPQNTFATLVTRCAITSPPLLYAILATSARHLSTINSDHNGFTADRFHRKCLALLIPVLDSSNAELDEALYAATVILRVYEEISVPLAGRDYESHLMGTHTFVRAVREQEYHQQSAIQQAAFRVVLRQEIVHTFRTQRPVQLLEKYVQVGKSLDLQDDSAVAFQIFVLCAEVITMCYGEGQKTPEAWKELDDRVRTWMESKPITFEPLIDRQPSESTTRHVFPEIWLLHDCHVAAHTHYLICRILLVAHDPTRPQLGPKRAEAVEASNAMIRDHVRNICGIASSNTHCIPSMFTACIAIAICGDLFFEYKEQKAMHDMLVYTDTKLAWPTRDIQTYLRRQWGWDL